MWSLLVAPAGGPIRNGYAAAASPGARRTVTAYEPIGLLAVFVYLGAVVASLPAAATVLLLARRMGAERLAALVGLTALVLVSLVSIGVSVLAGPDAGLALAGYGVVALAVTWTVPALVGRWLVRRLVGQAVDVALGYAAAGLPVALVASAAWFAAPGGPTRYDLTSLSGPALWAAAAVLLAIVVLGPGLVGVGLLRFAGRRPS